MVLLLLLVVKPYPVLAFKPQMIHLAFIATATAGGVHVVGVQFNVFMALTLAVAVVLVGALTAPVAQRVPAFAVTHIVA